MSAPEEQTLLTEPSFQGRVVIVIPCYNEESRLDTAAFERFLKTSDDISFVFVNDGSRDGTLAMLRRFETGRADRVYVLDLPANGGKAEAVRQGVLFALDVPDVARVGFWDADLATPLELIPQFVALADRLENVDIVMGCRVALLGRDIDRKASRHYLGRIFATAASMVLSIPVYDTQCGAKLFRVNGDTRTLFADPFGSRWIFDVELIARHLKVRPNGHGIYELPLDSWKDVGESKVRSLDFVRAISEMIRIYRRYSLSRRYAALLELISSSFLRYTAAGVVGTLLHFGILSLLVKAFGVSPPIGTMAGATAGALVNYVINYHFTFASSRTHRSTLPKFIVVALVGVLLNGLILHLGSRFDKGHFLIAQMFASVTVLLVGYSLNKAWTFLGE